jgi:putative spermidine/putrescine transport system substrate-binding protein
VVAGAQEPDLAYSYVDSHLAADLQAEMSKEPWNVIPTNGKVPLSGLIAEQIAKTPEELNDMVFFDWKKINEGRPEWTDRFNKEIRV